MRVFDLSASYPVEARRAASEDAEKYGHVCSIPVLYCSYFHYSHVARDDVSVNDGPHIRRW